MHEGRSSRAPWLLLSLAILATAGCLPRDFPRTAADDEQDAAAGRPQKLAPVDIDPAILRERRFGEAPELHRLAAEGKLPPVSERLPEDPLVMRPIRSIGRYGGEIRRDILGEFADISDIRSTTSENLLGFSRPVASRIEPNLAASYTMSKDGREAVFRLRRGIRWSDGVPFTVDDILFWYDDCMINPDAFRMGVVNPDWLVAGKPVRMEKIDDFTLKVSADEPMGTILRRFCHYEAVFAKHHYARFHPKYNPDATYEGFRRETTNLMEVLQPGVPKLGAWVPTQWVHGQQIVYERNPYYWKIDTAGNQLPYVDRIVFTVIPDPQVALLKFTNGELDLLGRNLELDAVPTLLRQLRKGRYRLYSRNPEPGPAFYLNFDAEDPMLRQAFRDIRVRQALSLALNRKEISEIVFLGLLEAGGFAFTEASPYFDPELFHRNADFDPGRARKLLAEAGYRDRDGDGYLEFPDGRRFELTIDLTKEHDLAELAREYWRAIGIYVYLNPGRQEIIYRRRLNGQFQVYLYFTIAAGVEPRTSPFHWAIFPDVYPFWHRNASKEGGPPWLEEVTKLMNEALTTVDEAEVRRLIHRIEELYVQNQPAIGTGALNRPWAANARLRNVPHTGTFAGAFSGWSRGIMEEQMYYAR